MSNYWFSPRKISKDAFYANGGFANTRQFRKMISGEWVHYAY
jgi:hypothetical protein